METSEDKILEIKIRKVLAAKSPKWAKRVPGFVYRWLEKTIYLDEINRLLRDYHDKQGADFAKAVIDDLQVVFRPHGLENVPRGERYVFVSNHPLGGLDGLALIYFLGSRYGSIRFVVNDLLMNIKPLRPVFVPVNKHGRQSQEYARMIEEAYAGPSPMLYFPAGLCSRKIKGRIVDLPWKKNVVQQAVKHRRDIVPVYFEGRNSNFFYNLAKLRKFLKIGFNVEMLFLPREMFKKRNATFDLYFGRPVSHETLAGTLSPGEWIRELRNRVYNLSKNC